MLSALLSLLFLLGFCLGHEEAEKDAVLPRPVLSIWPGPVVGPYGNVTFRCWSDVPNVTFTLGKLQDAGYKLEQRVAGHEAEFLLHRLEPTATGTYFCAYRKVASGSWSQASLHVQLQVKDHPDGQRAPPSQSSSQTIFVATFSCLCIVLLFISIILIYRRMKPDPDQEEATSSHSGSLTQEPTVPSPGLPAP